MAIPRLFFPGQWMAGHSRPPRLALTAGRGRQLQAETAVPTSDQMKTMAEAESTPICGQIKLLPLNYSGRLVEIYRSGGGSKFNNLLPALTLANECCHYSGKRI